MTSFSRDQLMLILALVAGSIGMAVSGSVLAFNVTANAIKNTFNYTQTEVEVMGSMGNIGINIGIPAGLMFEKFGAKWTLTTGLLLTSLAGFLLYSTILQKEFYTERAYLQYIYFLVLGFGAIFISITCVSVNVINFRPKHRGKIIGILDGCFSGGPSVYALIYGTYFVNGHTNNDEDKQNLSGYYLLCAILFCLATLPGLLLLVPRPLLDEIDVYPPNEVPKPGEKTPMKHPNVPPDVTGCELLKDFDFHFMVWSFWMCVSVQVMFQNNITTFLKSFHMEEYSTLLTTVTFITGAAGKIGSGFGSDILVHSIPRVLILLIATVIQAFVLFLCIFWGDNFIILLVAVTYVGFSGGVTSCLTVTIISELFGRKYFARNVGSVMIGCGVGGLLLQKIFGAIYEDAIQVKGEKSCYELACFQWSFVIASVLSLCAVLFYFGVWERRRKRCNI